MESRLTPEEFAILLQRFIENSCSREEVDQLTALLDEPAYHGLAMEMVEGTLQQVQVAEGEIPESVLNRLRNRLPEIISEKEVLESVQPRSISRSLFYKMRWVAAAVFILLAGAAAYFLLPAKHPIDGTVALQAIQAPDKNRATVTLANGQTIYLDSAGNGQLASIGNVKLEKLADGRVVYTGDASTLQYNTLVNPKGSRAIDIGLSDGTHVWLNAGSSITYPVAFLKDKERSVTMTGEAYFEVVHRDELGFVVQKGNVAIKVLGTHFNVNAYDNEPQMKVTLLEGSVLVSRSSQRQLLKPDQQAVLNHDGIELIKDADIDQAIAWKNGITSFHSADIATVLREIERWYNIETEINGNVAERSFYADVSRDASLAEILKVLEVNKVKYAYDSEKRKLVVTP